MRKILTILLLLVSFRGFAQTSDISLLKQLVAKEQKLADAIAVGDKAVWDAALHDSCMITVEDGSYTTKAELLKDFNPLPPAYKGMIKIIDPKLKVYGNTAVITYISDEYLELYGQKIHTQYRQSNTWVKLKGVWKKIDMQVFEIPKNPPPVTMSETVLLKYTGTYELSNDRKCVVSIDKGKLYTKKNDKEPVELLAETENVFFRKTDGRIRVIFVKESGSDKYKMIERRAGEDVVWSTVK